MYNRNITGMNGFTLNVPANEKFANVFGTDVSNATINMPGQAGFFTLGGYSYGVTANLGTFGNILAIDGEDLNLTVGRGGVITGEGLYDTYARIGEGGVGSFSYGEDLSVTTDDAGKWGEGVTLVLDEVRGDVEAYLTNDASDTVGIVLPAADDVGEFYVNLGSSEGWRGDGDRVTISPATGGGSATVYLAGFDMSDELILAMPTGAASMQHTTLGRDVAAVVREIDANTGGMIATVTRIVGPGSWQPDGAPTGLGTSIISALFNGLKKMAYGDNSGYDEPSGSYSTTGNTPNFASSYLSNHSGSGADGQHQQSW